MFPCALWSVDLKLTHLDWNPEATLIHFLGQYLSICELDYNILQREIQNTPKLKSTVDVGDLCLVEDLNSAGWYRGRIHGRKEDIYDVFLIDYGNILSLSFSNIYTCSDDLFSLPPKIVCGFLANVLLLKHCPVPVLENYFLSLIGKNVTGHIHALLPHKVLLLETPEVNNDIVKQGFGRHMDTDTFLLLVEMVTERQLKQNIEPVPDLLIEKPKRQEMYLKVSGLHGYDDILTSYGPKLSYGTCAKVRLTAAVNPGLFYCQMASMEKELREMSKKMESVCGPLSTVKTSENLGSLCAVKGKDNKWYRGLVQFLPVNSQVRVLFIDYGFSELVRVENLHRLPLDFDSVPIMAFPCCLSSLNNANDDVHAQQLTFLKTGLLGNVLDVEIRGTVGKHAHLIMITGTGENYVEEVQTIQVGPLIKEEKERLQLKCGYLYHQTALRERLLKTLEANELQEGSAFVGYVTHAHNPQQFWMCTQKRNSDFEKLMADIEAYYREKALDEEVLLKPTIGTACCAVYEKDMHFYRGLITDTLMHGAEVFFIDFGNTEKVPSKLIKKMPDAFASQPGFAFCCSLFNVLPLDDVWTTNNCDFFRRSVSNKALLAHITQFKKNKVAVDLREMESDINQSISAFMITSKQAEHWNNIPIHTVIEGTDFAGNVKFCDKEPPKSTNQSEKALESLCFKELDIKPGSELAVCCSSVNSPSDFWCQPLDQKEIFKELMHQIQLYYSTHTVVLKPGLLCCIAKLPHKKIWYRALITKHQRRTVDVILIDYGCTANINRYNIQGVAPEFVHLEQQAFHCTLDSQIEPTEPGDWSAAACILFQDFVCDSRSALRCKISSQLNEKNGKLYNVVDLDGNRSHQSVKKLLLEKHLAKEKIISNQLFSGFPEKYVLSQFNINPDQEELIYVTHVNSHWDFYCQLGRNTDVLEELKKKIAAESETMTQSSLKGLGKLCLAKYLDGNWYRAVARPVNFSPLHLCVFFVDYGNTSITEKEHVMFIPRDCADLLEIPMQALRCHLALLKKEVLHPEVKEYFTQTVLNRQIRAHITGTNNDGSLDVELFDGEHNINQKVKELIASLVPKAKPAQNIEQSSTEKKVLSRIKVATSVHNDVSLDTSPTERKQVDVCRKAAWTSVKNDSRSMVCASKPTALTGTGITGHKNDLSKKYKKMFGQGQSQKKETKLKLQKAQAENSDTSVKQRSEQLRFAPTETSPLSCLANNKVTGGIKAVCFVSHIDSSKSFFLQLEDDELDILKMVTDLNSCSLKESLKKATSFQVGDLVVAVYEEDGALYRAALKDCKGGCSFNVEFVDYGNTAAIEKEKMYSLPTEFLFQPRFSIPCFLSDPRPYESEASFVDAVMEKPLLVEFICQLGTHWEVKVETLNGAERASAPLPPEMAIDVVTGSEKTAIENKGMLFVSEKDKQNDIVNKFSMPTDERMYVNVEMTPNKQLSLSQTLLHTNDNEPSCSESQNKAEDEKGQAQRLLFASVHLNRAYAGSATAVKTPSEFYVLLEDSRDAMSQVSALLHGLPLELFPLTGSHITPGSICLFKSDRTQTWCRAEIVHLDTTVVLSLVDSGHHEHVPSSALRILPAALRNLPKLAYRCSLSGVMPVTPDCKWSKEAETHFQQCLSEKNLQIIFREFVSDYYWKVDVLVGGAHMAKELVDAGHATYIDVLLKLRYVIIFFAVALKSLDSVFIFTPHKSLTQCVFFL